MFCFVLTTTLGLVAMQVKLWKRAEASRRGENVENLKSELKVKKISGDEVIISFLSRFNLKKRSSQSSRLKSSISLRTL